MLKVLMHNCIILAEVGQPDYLCCHQRLYSWSFGEAQWSFCSCLIWYEQAESNIAKKRPKIATSNSGAKRWLPPVTKKGFNQVGMPDLGRPRAIPLNHLQFVKTLYHNHHHHQHHHHYHHYLHYPHYLPYHHHHYHHKPTIVIFILSKKI